MREIDIINDERHYGLDLLRIIAALLIVCHHCIINDFGLQSYLVGGEVYWPVNKIMLIFCNAFAVVGVNVFFLLSGYFQIHFKMDKIILIILKVYILYNFITYLGVGIGTVELDISTIKSMLDPLDKYWYIMTYVLLMICSPLLNSVVEKMNEKYLKLYLCGFFIICCFYGFLFDFNLHINKGYSLLMAMALYILGAGIHKFHCYNEKKVSVYLFRYLLIAILNGIVISMVYRILGGNYAWEMYSYNNPLIVLESIYLLMGFCCLTINRNVGYFISKFAKATITVYLLSSTCWLASFRGIPIIMLCRQNKFGIALLLLPIYAIFIYFACHLCDRLYEKVIGSFANYIAEWGSRFLLYCSDKWID